MHSDTIHCTAAHLASNTHIHSETALDNRSMASSQASEVVAKDEIRQSVQSIIMDLEVNPWEVIAEQYNEEEYEQVITVLREMLDSFETPRDIRPKCLKCLQAMAKHVVGLDDQTYYLDNWRAIHEIIEHTLADSYSMEWNLMHNWQLPHAVNTHLPYAVDILLEELNSLQPMTSSNVMELWKKQNHVFLFLRYVARRVRFDDPAFPHIIVVWALMVPMSARAMSELLPHDYMLEDLRYVVNILLRHIDSQDTSRETQLKSLWCLLPIAGKMSLFLRKHRGNIGSNVWCLFVAWTLRISRPWEAILEFLNSMNVWDIVHVLVMSMSAQHENKIKCMQCLQAIAHATWSSLYESNLDKEEYRKAVVLRLLVDQIMLELGTLSTEELGVVVEILQEELYRLDTSREIRKSCIEGLQAIAQVSNLVPPVFALDDIEKRVINTVVTETLSFPKPWEFITKLDKDGYQSAVDTLQENLDSVDTSPALRASSIKCLQAISRVSDVVPSSFILEGIKKEGNHSLFRGGFADVWQGRDRLGTIVCLKVLRTYHDKQVDGFKALHREALIWRQLKHPRIHPFIGIVRDIFPDQLCLVSPWANNGNLCDFLKANPEMNRLNLLIQIAEGIDYLHSHDPQIVHADIRGVNILVKDDDTCCLADFGLTMMTETQAPTTNRMRSGATRWMPPEVLDTRDNVFAGGNHKSSLSTRDVYSFGCTFVEIFSGKAPFPSIKWDAQVITEVIVNGATPSRPSTIHLTDDLWRVAASCLSYDLTMRPSIQKVLSQLRTCHECL